MFVGVEQSKATSENTVRLNMKWECRINLKWERQFGGLSMSIRFNVNTCYKLIIIELNIMPL